MSNTASRTPRALYALTAGAFGIGTTEFVIMGLLLQVAADLNVTIASAGLLISGYALGVFIGAPLLTIATSRLPRKTVLAADHCHQSSATQDRAGSTNADFHRRQYRLRSGAQLHAADAGASTHFAGARHFLWRW
jgi:hypothetical protein